MVCIIAEKLTVITNNAIIFFLLQIVDNLENLESMSDCLFAVGALHAKVKPFSGSSEIEYLTLRLEYLTFCFGKK